MKIALPQKLKTILSSLVVAVVLLLVLIGGANAGKTSARAETVAKIAKNLVAGLDDFYRDQDRFPSAAEFSDNNIMLNYFSVFPPQDFLSAKCPGGNFIYKRLDLRHYQLNFCLPKPALGYKAGWN